jgi:hypothetical protein
VRDDVSVTVHSTVCDVSDTANDEPLVGTHSTVLTPQLSFVTGSVQVTSAAHSPPSLLIDGATVGHVIVGSSSSVTVTVNSHVPNQTVDE